MNSINSIQPNSSDSTRLLLIESIRTKSNGEQNRKKLKKRVQDARSWDKNPESRKFALKLAEKDIVFFVETFCMTYDPREEPSLIPFILYDKQKDALRWLRRREETKSQGVWEKSRDAGATWLCAAYAVHRWLFRPGAAIGFGSRKLELVDKIGDPKSIFDKVRVIIANLPSWLMDARATGFNEKVHDNFCKIINPKTGATITGEGGDNIGRGGRTTIYFVDEAAHIEHPKKIEKSLVANSASTIWLSTPEGMSNPFAEKRHSGKFPVLTIEWKDDERKAIWVVVPASWESRLEGEGDPDMDQKLELRDEDILRIGLGGEKNMVLSEDERLIYPWYEEKRLIEDEVTIAQEYDIDYTASLEGVVCPAKWLNACIGLVLPDSLNKVGGFDVAGGGSADYAYIARNGPTVKRIVRWREGDPTDAAYKAMTLAEEDRLMKLFYDVIGVGAGVGGVLRRIKRKLCFQWYGINVGKSPTKAIWPDRKRSDEKFQRLKGELWFRLRIRAEKTYNYVTKGTYYPPDELLSLPPGPLTKLLIAQASNLTFDTDESGKIVIEKKSDLQRRGVASPDLAEALILSFAPTPRSSAGTKAGGKKAVATAGPQRKAADQAGAVVRRRRRLAG